MRMSSRWTRLGLPFLLGATTVVRRLYARARLSRGACGGKRLLCRLDLQACAGGWRIGCTDGSDLVGVTRGCAAQSPDRSGLSHSPDLRAAEARLRESRGVLRQQRSNRLPKIAGNAAYLHLQLPDSPLGTDKVNFYNLGFDATWELDLFGGTRRAVEAASAEAYAGEADLADAQVQLSAEIAKAYIGLRDSQQRLELVKKSAEIEDKVLTLTQQRRERGVASDLEVERVRTQVENTRAAMIPLDEEVAEALDQLALLTGREPGALDAELAATAPLPTLPAVTPIGDPASLLRQRPDIRAAEFRLASKNAVIGQRIAEWFPKITLIGDLGFSSATPRRTGSQRELHVGGRTAASVERARLRTHPRARGSGQGGVRGSLCQIRKHGARCASRCECGVVALWASEAERGSASHG